MNAVAEQSKKGLLLVSNPNVFKVLEAAMEEVGCQMTDNFDTALNVDLVVIDSFYLKAGMADFVKTQNTGILTLLVLLPAEAVEFQGQLTDKIDDSILLQPHHRHEDLFFLAVDWFRSAWDVACARLLLKQFGTGLWVSLMFRLAALSGMGAPGRNIL